MLCTAHSAVELTDSLEKPHSLVDVMKISLYDEKYMQAPWKMKNNLAFNVWMLKWFWSWILLSATYRLPKVIEQWSWTINMVWASEKNLKLSKHGMAIEMPTGTWW